MVDFKNNAMKRIMTVVCLTMIMACAWGQEEEVVRDSVDRDSVLSLIYERLGQISESVEALDRYKMYATENIYNLLKLDTRTGMIEQIQWSLDRDEEHSVTINDVDLSWSERNGTFELYPTKNMYQFILLDKSNGRTWHVQWGHKRNERWMRRIY